MLDKDEKDNKKTDRQKLKYGGSYARARLLQQLCSFFFRKSFNFWIFVFTSLLTQAQGIQIHLFKTKSKSNGKYNDGKHKYTNPKEWARTIAEWPVGFLWAAPCWWVHLSQASGRRIFNATQILYCRTNSTYIQCVPHFQSHSLLHQEYQSKSILQKFFIAVQMLKYSMCHIFKHFFKEMTH